MTASATAEGTRRFAARFADSAEGWFREAPALGVTASAVGLGTYLGPATDAADAEYVAAIRRALELGANVIDTAANYRFQRSERAIGSALKEAGAARDEVVIATKGGYLPFDGKAADDPVAYFYERFVKRGVARAEDLVAGCHCMTPAYLKDQLAQSLANLGAECVEIYYLHNPEQQLDEVDRLEFMQRMRAAFEALEAEADAGRLRIYGTATWNGYRVATHAPEHLELSELLAVAHQVAGDKHRFRAIQLPYNLAMPEAYAARSQRKGEQSLLDVARGAGMCVMASASLLQARLPRAVPPDLLAQLGTRTGAQAALQFVRSTPGVATALVGMRTIAHVEENLALRAVPSVDLRKGPLGAAP